MDTDFEAQLRADGVVFDAGDAALLAAIAETGSLNRAADSLGRSYSRSHARVADLEAAFGPLVERQRGGSGGGGSTLTDAGRALLDRFDRLQRTVDAVTTVPETVLDGTVTDREGELGTVETALGAVRALVPPEEDDVRVTLRADAVTLHDPDEVPSGAGTSARNRFEGAVTSVDAGESVCRVTVDAAGHPVTALVTAESRARLSLAPGRAVVVSFKATATHATPA
ncbi:MAG: TOBE domain-containing protein [Halobacteriaceae archaeon]